MTLHPLEDRIVVRPDPSGERTVGGIIVPENVSERGARHGEVVAIGPGRRLSNGVLVNPEVVVGDRVVFNRASGQTVRHDGEDLVVLRAAEVLGVEVAA